MRRTTTLSIGLAAVVAAAAGGWYAGSQIKSPAQVAAETEPPPPSRITVPVEMRTLGRDIIIRGDVRFDQPAGIALADPPAVLGGASIVTLAPDEGTNLTEGALVIEVSGRPILVLQGDLPMFRTIRPGDKGDDVVQLEEALVRIGFDPGAVDGVYDAATAGALVEWYRSLGYEPIGPNEQEQAELDSAKASVDAAGQEVTFATQSLAAAKAPLPQSQILELDAAVASAERALVDAQANAEVANAAAVDSVGSAEQAVVDATAAQEVADARYAQALGGTHPDTGLPPTPEELIDLQQTALDATAALDEANSILAQAIIDRDQTARNGAGMVADAEDQLAIQKARRTEMLKPPSTSDQEAALAAARKRLNEAQADYDALLARTGVIAQRSEIMFMRRLPVRIDRVFVERGDGVGGEVMQVTGSEMAIDTSIALADADLINVGDEVIIEDSYSDITTTGTVTKKGDRPGTNGVDGDRIFLEVSPLEDLSEGFNVKLTIPVESTGGDVLAVPLAALSATADGSTRVEVEHDDGSTAFIVVTIGLDAGGYAEISAVDGEIQEGDRVVVGTESAPIGPITDA
ncbi:MAG: peptidoglycan-binding protein [Acidimicrobiia bacterium]|nr:peptidoglycan-binding protein [Acidimicrobiia bacterium]